MNMRYARATDRNQMIVNKFGIIVLIDEESFVNYYFE